VGSGTEQALELARKLTFQQRPNAAGGACGELCPCGRERACGGVSLLAGSC